MSGPEVIGLIGAIFTILRETKEIYEAAKGASGLTKKLRHTADELEFVEYVLNTAKEHLEATAISEDEIEKARPLLEICREKLDLIKQIFAKHLPALHAGRAERFIKAARAQLKKKGDEMKEAMGVVLQQLELLAQNEILKSADMLTDIKNAIEEMEKVTDDEEGYQFNNYGNGPFNPNIGGKQENYSHSGGGHQYNGTNHIHHATVDPKTDSRVAIYEKPLVILCSKRPPIAKRCVRLLQVMVLVQRPLDVDELSSVSDMFNNILEVEQALEWCAPFMSRDRSGISLHETAQEYLESPDIQSRLARFGTFTHGDMGRSCLEYLQRHLVCNSLELERLDSHVFQLSDEQLKRLLRMRYASTHWAKHIELSVREGSTLPESYDVHNFMRKQGLEWAECLFWCEARRPDMFKNRGPDLAKKVLESLAKIAKLSLSDTRLDTELEYLSDFIHFLGYFSQSYNKPLQIYPFALMLRSSESLLHEQSLRDISRWAKSLPSLQKRRPTLHCVLNEFSYYVQDAAVAFSPDGSLLAVAWGPDHGFPIVGLWHIETKQLRTWKLDFRAIFGGGSIRGICCSPDNRRVACVSRDGRILVVDADTGRQEQALCHESDHDNHDRELVFSNDGSILASAVPLEIRLWDLKTGHLQATLSHSAWTHESATSLAFSPDDQRLVSGHRTGLVIVWDISQTGDERVVKLQGLPDKYGVFGRKKGVKVAFCSEGRQILANGYRFEASCPDADFSGSQVPEVLTHDGDKWLYYQQKPLLEHAKYQDPAHTWDIFKDYLVLSHGPEIFVVNFLATDSE